MSATAAAAASDNRFKVLMLWLKVMNSWNTQDLKEFIANYYSKDYRSSALTRDGTSHFYDYSKLYSTYSGYFQKRISFSDMAVINIGVHAIDVVMTMRWPSGASYRTRAVFQFVGGRIAAAQWSPA